MVPEKELQPAAFSVMPLVWSLGSIIGPSFGGLFANPAVNYPSLFGNNAFLIAFPFALPNLLAGGFFLIGITTGILFLHETLESKRHKPDWGRRLGKKLTTSINYFLHPSSRPSSRNFNPEDSATLLPSTPMSSKHPVARVKRARPTIYEVFTVQSAINLLAYTVLCMHSSSFDQLLPIFMHSPPSTVPNSGPLKFTGGFGLASSRIGTFCKHFFLPLNNSRLYVPLEYFHATCSSLPNYS